MATRRVLKSQSGQRLNGRDYAIMRKVATEAVTAFKNEIPPMIEQGVVSTLERIGIDASTPQTRERIRERFSSIIKADQTRTFVLTTGLGAFVKILIAGLAGAMWTGLIVYLTHPAFQSVIK